MENVLSNHEELDQWFIDIKRWDRYECCETRRTWIEVFGVPLHGWNWENFKNIVEIWGMVECWDTPIKETFSFESMRILISADRLHSIEDELILSIEDKIMIKEASCVIAPQIKISTSSSMKIRDSNVEEYQGVVMATNEDVASSGQPMEVKLEDDIGQEVVKETQMLEVEPTNTPGFDTPLLEESEELSQPPGFESVALVDSTPMPRKKAPKRHFEEDITSMNDSSRTSKSDIRLAKEALKIGNLLGIKVLDKEDAATKRIIRSLKQSKKA
ncbi:LOW QUALITY PROTEIN: hypothetical protein Cgig2_016557 [Carnegiea gigantea]|uniref:DUF4283 domain-containing protein n=1 Tax=Carnegiea gigantea TaxID=171969 RepID=A0A9Q1KW48_9CARY|nr:LOW QUALITY PROTEIN: hypothetical protein Cgig2_016557 [Carnegiea gigantea]